VCGLDGNFIKNYDCYFCKISHVVPSRGFYPNFYLKHQVDSFEMKQNLSKSLTDLEDTLNDIENLEKMLKEYFSELRKKIAFQKEFLVKKSKNLSENLSGRVEQLEENYLIDLNEMRLHREEFKSVKLLSETAFQNLKLESDNLNNIGRLNIKDDDYEIVYRYRDGLVKINRLNANSCSGEILKSASSKCFSLKIIQNKLIAALNDKKIQVLCLKTRRLIKSLSNFNVCNVITLANGVNPDEVICGFHDGEIRIFNYDTEKILSRLIGHQAIINNLEVLSKQILISSLTDFQLRIWCLYTNKCLKTILETKRTNAIEKIDENSFATGSEDNSIKKVLFLLPFIINHNLK